MLRNTNFKFDFICYTWFIEKKGAVNRDEIKLFYIQAAMPPSDKPERDWQKSCIFMEVTRQQKECVPGQLSDHCKK